MTETDTNPIPGNAGGAFAAGPSTDLPVAPSLPAATGVGAVHLSVTDAGRALAYYREVVGLTPIEVDDGRIHLGSGARELVVLYPGAAGPVAQNHTGLYHLALLVPSRRELARVVARLGQIGIDQYPTDHVMTKSDYIWDPDGNGIEIYAESPEDGTFAFAAGTFAAYDNQGRMRSGRDPIDIPALMAELQPGDRLDQTLPAETKMGHVHLHIRDVDEAVSFYHGLVGFDVMGIGEAIGAAFVSAGGYHHHLGLNIWAGRGAPPAPPNTAGLRHFTIEVPTEDDLAQLVSRLRNAGVEVSETGEGLFAADPSANRFSLRVRTV
ncbi:MAG TPA: VOC family protein [Candidatus Solibacter sp.]|nr:VOC family protein [Candidatus Solibacter sp.]